MRRGRWLCGKTPWCARKLSACTCAGDANLAAAPGGVRLTVRASIRAFSGRLGSVPSVGLMEDPSCPSIFDSKVARAAPSSPAARRVSGLFSTDVFSGDVIDLLIYSTMYHHAAWPAGGVARRRSCPVSVSRLLPSTSSRAPDITLKRMLRFSCYSGGVEATPYSCLAPVAGVRQLRLASPRGARGIALACAPRFSHLDA